ncbi:MAG: hypothetical protein Q4B09_07520 [Lachnospiraceae bacterium]|nr:hypothetical protein [Lachnospiraceae bacterium]
MKKDIKTAVLKEYQRSKKTIATAYFLILLSVLCYLLFFLHTKEPMLVGTGILFDIAAVTYVFRALRTIHPYWEMQLALTYQKKDTEYDFHRFLASLEIAKEQQLPAFNERAKEIFQETLEHSRKSSVLSASDVAHLEQLLAEIR